MFKIILVIVAVLAMEEVAGGGDGICDAENQAAMKRVQVLDPLIATESAQCLQTFQSTFDTYKAASNSTSQFNANLSTIVNGCIDALRNLLNQFLANVANDIGVGPGQLVSVIVGSGPFTPPVSCVKDLILSEYNNIIQTYNGYLAKANELAAAYPHIA